MSNAVSQPVNIFRVDLRTFYPDVYAKLRLHIVTVLFEIL